MLYEKALKSINLGKDVDLGPIQVCEVCGYILEEEAPEICPICCALKDKFTAFK
jgi:rubrerythrin